MSLPDASVRVYRSSDTGAPVWSGTINPSAVIAVLDACLDSGYGSVTLDSLIINNNLATATKSTGHNFTAVGTIGPVLRISGASTPTAINGDWRVTITSTTQFTFVTEGISNQTATGTIAAKRAPLGFEKVFGTTEKGAYRALAVNSTRLYCRVHHSAATLAAIMGYESMTDIDSGTDPFSDASGSYINVSLTASSLPRDWRLFGDYGIFYLLVRAASNDYWDGYVFGDPISFKAGDAYHCLLLANTETSSYGFQRIALTNNTSGRRSARSYDQITKNVAIKGWSHGAVGGTLMPGLNPVDNALHFAPIDFFESDYPRGIMPGLYRLLHSSYPADATIEEAISTLNGHTIFIQGIGPFFRIAFDITGPWR